MGGTLALAYLAAVAIGAAALAAVTVLSALAVCGAALSRRPSRGLKLALAAIGVWLALGFSVAFALSHQATGGFAWVLLALYLVPLPVLPWIYARTFPVENDAAPEAGAPARHRGPEAP